MAKPTTYEFPPLKVSPLGSLGVEIDPATEEEQWALRQLLYEGDYPEEVLQDIFRDPGPYYRKMAQGFLRNNPYVKLEGPPTERTLPEGYEYIQPEEEAEIEIYDPSKPHETVWSAEDIAKGWRQPRYPARTPPAVRGPHDIEAIEDKEIKEAAKKEKAVTVIEEKAQEEREWWKRESKEKIIDKQYQADQAYIAGEIDKSQLAGINAQALKGINLKKGKGQDLSNDDLTVLYAYMVGGPDVKMIPRILKADFSNLDDLKNVSKIRYVSASDFDEKPYEYLRDLIEQAELIKMMQLIDPNNKKPKTLSDIRDAQAVLNKLKFSGKLTTMQHAKYNKPLNVLYRKIENDQKINEAGGLDAYRQETHKKRAEVFTRKAFYNQEKEMAKFERLRQRVFTIYVTRYLKENPGQIDLAHRRAIKKLNKLHPMPTLNFEEGPKIGASMIRGGGQWIWVPETNQYRKATDVEKLTGAFKRQVIGSGFPIQMKKAIDEAKRKQDFVDEYGLEKAIETGVITSLPQAAQRAIYPEKGEAFNVYETPAAAAMRNLGFMDSLVAATMAELTPKHAYGKDEKWKLSNSWVDNFSYNHSKANFFPEYFETVIGDVVGKNNAWWGGLFSSFGLPLTGIGTAGRLVARPGMRALGQTLRTAGAVSKSERLLTLGKEAKNAANFFNWMGEKAKAKRLENSLSKVMPQSDIKALVKKTKAEDSADFHIDEWLDLFKENVNQGSLNNKIVDRIAERTSGISAAKALIDSKNLNEESIQKLIQNKDLASLWLDSGQNIDVFTNRINVLWDSLNKASITDDISIAMFNQAKNVYNIVKNKDAIEATQKAAPWLEQSTRFDKEFNDSLFAAMVARLQLTDEEMASVYKRIAELPKEERTSQKMAEVLADIKPMSKPTKEAERVGKTSLSFGDAELSDIMTASELSLSKILGEKLLDYMPYQNMILMPGGVFQRRNELNDRWKILKFKKKYDQILGPKEYKVSIDPKKGPESLRYNLSDKSKKELIKILTKEIGISDYAASAYYQDLINKLLAKPPKHPKSIKEDVKIGAKDLRPGLSSVEFFTVKDLVARHLNKDIFNAIELKDLGKQAETATKELPGVIGSGALSVRSKSAIPSTSFGLGELTKAFKDLLFTKKYPVHEPTKGSLAFNQMLDRINAKQLKLTDQLKEEIKETAVRTRDPLQAVDKITEQTWLKERMGLDKSLDETVTRNFNGSYKNYVLSDALRTEGKDSRSLKTNVINQVKRAMKKDSLANEEELYRKWAQDYNAFIHKRNVWENMINRYYGIDLKNLQNQNERVIFDVFMKDWIKGMDRNMDPYASNMLNPSLSNFHRIINEINSIKNFDEKGLTSTGDAWLELLLKNKPTMKVLKKVFNYEFNPTKATSAAVLPWVLGSKRVDMVNKELKQYIDTNPTEVITGVLNPLSEAANLDPKPLYNYYKKIFGDILKVGSKATEQDPNIFADFKAQKIPRRIANNIINLISSGKEESVLAGKNTLDDLLKLVKEERWEEIDNLLGKPAIDALDIKRPGIGTTRPRPVPPAPQIAATQEVVKSTQIEDWISLEDFFAEAMAKAHLSALDKVSFHNRVDLLIEANRLKEGKGIRTLHPDYDKVGMTDTMRKTLNDVYKPMNEMVDALFNSIFEKGKYKRHYDRNIKPQLRKDMLGLSSDSPAFMSGLQYTILGNANRAVNDLYRSSGSAYGDMLPTLLKENSTLLSKLGNTNYFKIYGRELSDAMNELKRVSNSANVDFVADRLRNDKFGRLVLNSIADTLDAVRATSVSGMLAGWLLPGTRHMGMNTVTGPAIATTTVGKHGLGTINPQMHRTVTTLNKMPADKLVFTSKDGIPYTAGELRYLMGITNRGFSEEQLHFAQKNAKDIMRHVNLTINGLKKGRLKSFIQKHYDPRNLTIWSTIAMKTDQHFRDTVFLQALKNGLQPGVAAKIAQRSLLDYGSPSKEASKLLGKYFLFWRFKLIMATETINDLSRAIAKDQPSYAINSMKAMHSLMRDANTVLNTDDSAKTRILPIVSKVMGEKPVAAIAGPAIPAAEVYIKTINSMYSGFSSMLHAANGEWDESFISKDKFVNLLKDGEYIPVINLIRDAIRIDSKRGGKKFRDDYIPALKAAGLWEQVKETFNIEAVDREKQKFAGPAYGDRYIQYKFGDANDEFLFALMTFAATMAGVDRNIRDYGKLYMTMTDPTAKRTYGRYSEPDPLLYALGIQTSIPLFDPQDKGRKELMKMMRELNKELKQGEPLRKGE